MGARSTHISKVIYDDINSRVKNVIPYIKKCCCFLNKASIANVVVFRNMLPFIKKLVSRASKYKAVMFCLRGACG